jgi:hypothetical protein
LVSHAGTALLARVANKVGLTKVLSSRLAGLKVRRSGYDLVRVVRDWRRWLRTKHTSRTPIYERRARALVSRDYVPVGSYKRIAAA